MKGFYFEILFFLLLYLFCFVLLSTIYKLCSNNSNLSVPINNTTNYLSIPETTTIQLINIDNLNSKTNHKYDLINFRLYQDLIIDNKLILPKDTNIQGMITKIHKGRLLGERAIIRIKLNNITLSNENTLCISPDLKLKGGNSYTNIVSNLIVPFSGYCLKEKKFLAQLEA